MLEIIRRGAGALDALKRLESAAKDGDVKGQPLSGVKLLAPIPRPQKNVFCLGLNYQAHIDEGRAARGAGMPGAEGQPSRPAWPTYFTRAPPAVIGPDAPIPPHDNVTQALDWEVELALIIGDPGINISQDDAYNHIFGYTVLNDVSAREVQRRHGQQWFKGK